jgi:amino acid transporter
MFKRSISSMGLFFTAVGGIIGSGWLFGPMYAAQIAGPAAIVSWILGGILMLFISFTFAELAAAFPRAGGMVHFGSLSHGAGLGFVIGWMIWLSSVVIAPVETLALLQYSATYIPGLMHTVGGVHMLTLQGTIAAAIIMGFMVVLNALGASFFSKSNTPIVLLKIGVPMLVVLVLLIVDFHSSNFVSTTAGGFAPFGWKGIITALPLGGIIFSFIGSSSAINLGGEAKNPQVGIPLAIIGSILFCMILYVLIQTAFIGALEPNFLAKGWSHLSFTGDAGPFAGILIGLGVSWMVLIIYADAFVSPFGTGYIYTAGTARAAYALSEIGFFSKFLQPLSKAGVPVRALILNYLVGILLFLPFHGWQNMVEFLISCFVIAYSVGPISLYVLRRTQKNLHRPFKLPAYQLVCYIAFYICNLLVIWVGWNIVQNLLIAILIGSAILVNCLCRMSAKQRGIQIQQNWWLLPYIAGLGTLSYLSSFGGGKNVMCFGYDFVVMALFSLVIFSCAVRSVKTDANNEVIKVGNSVL